MYKVDRLYRIDDSRSDKIAWVRFERKLTHEEEEAFLTCVESILAEATGTENSGYFRHNVQEACVAFARICDICGYTLNEAPFHSMLANY